ncbi:hypothetical protein ACHAQA_002526 [Verticillium albo-atrum]
MPSLLSLPNETLVEISTYLLWDQDLNSLGLTSRFFHDLLHPRLYRRQAEWDDSVPLFWAADHGLVSTATQAIAAGVYVDGQDARDMTPLAVAVYRNHIEIASLLLQAGAFVDTRDRRGDRPIMSAAYWGRVELCKLLLDHGSRTDCLDGKPPLAMAAARGSLGVVKLLLEYGADPEAREQQPSQPPRRLLADGYEDPARERAERIRRNLV